MKIIYLLNNICTDPTNVSRQLMSHQKYFYFYTVLRTVESSTVKCISNTNHIYNSKSQVSIVKKKHTLFILQSSTQRTWLQVKYQ